MSSLTAVSPSRQSTLYGMLAILLWSTTIAFSRSLTEQLGTFTAAAWIYGLAGAAGLLLTSLRPGGLRALTRLPRAYLLGCGALFVAYIVALYLAIGFAATRTQVLAVGLINYLWPGLSLLFSVPILQRRARPLLPVGILVAMGGVWLALSSGSDAAGLFWLPAPADLLPYGCALLAAICWGLYSTLSRRLAAEQDGGGVPLFLLASGVLLALARLAVPENAHWSASTLAALAYMALFPAMLAYMFWDIAVRKGKIILIASLSYLTPLLSTLISAFVLHVQPGVSLWLGAVLVIGGAVLCRQSVAEEA